MGFLKRLILLCLLAMVPSCPCRDAMRVLSNVESYIDDRPDSALAVLGSVDTASLQSRASRAKYALLYAMALEKNYIDTTDTRIIRPAVDYYHKHGSADEKLKALYFLGRVQYNAKKYDQAIVSFLEAARHVETAENLKYCGFVYAAIADTYSMTYNYADAKDYIDKSIDFFTRAGNPDLVNVARLRKAQNFVNRQEWTQADSLFRVLVRDTTVYPALRMTLKSDYAMMLLINPSPREREAAGYFSEVISATGSLNNVNQWCAYAYSLMVCGNTTDAESIFSNLSDTGLSKSVEYEYWQNRASVLRHDYRKAYELLNSSMVHSDTALRAVLARTALSAQKDYQEYENRQERLKFKNRLLLITISVLVLFLLMVGIVLFFRQQYRRSEEEYERAQMLIDALRKERCRREEKIKVQEDTISGLQSEKIALLKAKHAYLGSLYEIVHDAGEESDQARKRVYARVKEMVKDITSDARGQSRFERMLDDGANGIMMRFREAFRDLDPEMYRLASYIFAGFDNTELSLILNISTAENTRSKKSRLKKRISESTSCYREEFLSYF